MNMCTVQSIKDAIRENCQSQHDMESTDIDQVLQTLPFSEHDSPVQSAAEVQASLPALAEQQKQLKATVFFTKDCGFFSCPEIRKE